MKKSVLIVAALGALVLAGCASYRSAPSLESRSNVPVVVKDGMIVVPNPLIFLRGEENVVIRWQLPQNSKLRFPENGIVVEGALTDQVLRKSAGEAKADAVVLDTNQREIIDCRRAKEGLEFTCLNRNTKPGIYKYTIRVRDGDKLIERDPTLDNGPW